MLGNKQGKQRLESVSDYVVFDVETTVLSDFIEFIENLPLVGHNIYTFDMNFIYRDCKKYFNKVPEP